YYTPHLLASFITNRVLSFKRDFQHILEPSAGDGVFVNCIFENTHHSISDFSITVIEKNKDELIKINSIFEKNPNRNINYNPLEGDYLKLYRTLNNKYDIIIGNPPYIAKKRLTDSQITESNSILKNAGLKGQTNNIWPSFLVSCISLLKDDGIISFVLPSEMLQVKFSEEIRELLKKTFERIEIYTFNELLFDTIGQDTVIFIGFMKSDNKGIFYSNINKIEDLQINNYSLEKNDLLCDNNYKWIHHFLSQDELELISRLRKNLNLVCNFCISKPGIVTAANDFFIVNEAIVEKYKLQSLVKPIIQKGIFVNGKVEFDKNDFISLKADGHPSNLIYFHNKIISKHSKHNQAYLKKAYRKKIHKRYKMTVRDNWHIIPNLVEPLDAFFFKRSHLYPKLIKNSANVYVTDSAYSIKMNKCYDINSFIYSFYNSLTLIFAEMKGRYYGGGVLELTPSEFKNLPIPYVSINSKGFNTFKLEFANKTNIEEVLNKNDIHILKENFNVTDEELATLRQIRQKLISKRTNKSILPLNSLSHT
ncbi:MAG: type I restriction endonuclease subunit M, partial [Ignavibacteria bacterium]|nr:type I restriction endonuclease subunit M [Ignavibacteria bacterium]